MRLPYGRRFVWYWNKPWRRPSLKRLRAVIVGNFGPVSFVFYGCRMDWLDADRAVERLHQQRQRERGL